MPMDRLEHGHQAGVIEVCAYRDLRLKNMADMGHFFHSFINFIFLCRADSSKNDPYDPYLFQLRASFQHFMDERMLHKSAHVINCGQELVVIYSNINSGLRPIFLVGTALPPDSITHNGILKRPGAFPKYPLKQHLQHRATVRRREPPYQSRLLLIPSPSVAARSRFF